MPEPRFEIPEDNNADGEVARVESMQTLLCGRLSVLVLQRQPDGGLLLSEFEEDGKSYVVVIAGDPALHGELLGEPERLCALDLAAMVLGPIHGPHGICLVATDGRLLIPVNTLRFVIACLCTNILEPAIAIGAIRPGDFGQVLRPAFNHAAVETVGRDETPEGNAVTVRFVTDKSTQFDFWPDMLRAAARRNMGINLLMPAGAIAIPAGGVAELASQYWKTD